MPKNFTILSAADVCHCSPLTIRRLVKDGSLAASLIAGKYLISETDLTRFVRSKRTQHQKAAASNTSSAPSA